MGWAMPMTIHIGDRTISTHCRWKINQVSRNTFMGELAFGLVAFEIARRHRFAADMASVPEGVNVHVLPVGVEPPRYDSRAALRYPPGMDPDTRPQDDLFRHMNGHWLDSTDIPADRSPITSHIPCILWQADVQGLPGWETRGSGCCAGRRPVDRAG